MNRTIPTPMKFRPPFDEVQWDEAAATHAQMRANLRELRRDYPSASLEERTLLKRYRDVIQDFGRKLLKPHDRIDAVRLNELNDHAVRAIVAYLAIRGPINRGDDA